MDSADDRIPPYRALTHRRFRQLATAQLVSITGTQMQVLAINWHIWLLTGSPLALGLVGLTRVIPVIAFSLWGGVLADRHDRRRVMFLAQATMLLSALGLAAATFAGHSSLALIYGLNALSAAASAFDAPARQALVPRLVPIEDLPGALSINLTVFHVGMIVGPAFGGLILAGAASPGALHSAGGGEALASGSGGLATIYVLNAVSFLGTLGVLSRLPRESGIPPAAGASSEPMFASLRAGLRFVFTTPIMVWTTVLDFFATFFAGSMSLLPVFADAVLGVGPRGYGWLVAAPALGAVAGSLIASVRPLPRAQGKTFLWAVAAYGAATIVFGLSRSYVLTFVALAAVGMSDLVSTVIRQTLRQLSTPDELRGRMTSVNMIFFMGGPQLGEVEAGLVAALFPPPGRGAAVAVVSGGLATILVAAFVAALAPVVRNYRGATGVVRAG